MSNDDQAEKEVMEVTNQQHEDTKVSNETATTDAAQGGEEEKKEIHPRDIPGQSILVRQVTYSCGRDAIEEYFSKHCKVLDVHIPLNFNTKRPKGFAFVKVPDLETANEVIEKLNNKCMPGFEDRALELILATRPRKSRDDFRQNHHRGGYRNGGYGGGRRRYRSRSNDRRRPRYRSRSRSFDRRRRRSPSPRYRSRSPPRERRRSRSRSYDRRRRGSPSPKRRSPSPRYDSRRSPRGNGESIYSDA